MLPPNSIKSDKTLTKDYNLSRRDNKPKSNLNLILKKKLVIQENLIDRKKTVPLKKLDFNNANIKKINFKETENNLSEFKINGEIFKKFLDHYEKKANGTKKENNSFMNILRVNNEENLILKTEVIIPNILNQRKNINIRKNSSNKKFERPVSVYKMKNLNLGIFKKNLEKDYINELQNSHENIKEEKKIRPMSAMKENDFIGTNIILLNNEKTSKKPFGDIKDFIIGKEIGKGAYAIVRQSVHRPTGMKLAIKIYEKFKLMDPAKKSAVKREIQVLKQLDHPNIIKLYDVIDTPKQILLITDLVKGVSLLNFLKSKPNRKVTENDCKFIFIQVMKGIDYLHSKNIYHRDIKLDNILVNDKNEIKIIDFGFGTSANNTKLLNFFCGTPSYMPPEIVQKKDYLGSNADIWSLGILLFTLLSGSFPFRAMSEKELYTKIIKGIFIVPDHISSDAKNLIQKILIVNPNNRINSSDILSHEWMNTNHIEDVY